MKRLLCLALTLAMLAMSALPAAAEEATVAPVSEAVEEEVAAALDAGDTGLTVEGEAAPAETLAEAPADPIDTETADAAPEDEPATAVAAASNVAATGIQLSASAITVGVKEEYKGLTVSAVPAGAALPAVTWRSDNEKLVRVDQSGVVTGVKAGKANVFARFEGGQEVSCAVTVLKGPRKLVMSETKLTLGGDGQTTRLSYTMPSGYASNTFTWSSSNPKVATVDQNGVVTTVGAGKANIMVKAYNGKGGKCKVTVLGAPTGIAFPAESMAVALSQTRKLEPTVTFSTRKKADASVAFAISPNSRDSGCITLNAATGEITGVRKGTAVVTATTYNGKSAALTVTVAAAPTDIGLSQSAAYIGVKDVYSGLFANLSTPAGETDVVDTVVWTTSNKRIATVDQNGVITGVRKGSCVITATTVTGLKDTCKVTVFKAPKKVYISPASAQLKVGEVNQFKYAFPKNTGGTVVFTSSDNAIATIDNDGVVTAVAEGEVTVTVTAFNGKKATAKLLVKGKAGEDVDLPTQEYDSVESTTSLYRENMTNAEKLEYVIYCAQSMLGRPYVHGSGYHDDDYKVGFDCSGLVYWCFKRINIKLKDTAHKQGYDNSQQKIVSIASLKRGDIVCFNTVEDGADDLVDHTGIYLGNGEFIHASSSGKKVIKSSLSGYYSRTFSWGRRVLG